jgi:hypothetical protein
VPSFYIVLQEKVPGVDGAKLEARSLSKHISKLDVVAKQEGVKPLSSFFSAAREEVAGLLDGEPPDFDIPEEQKNNGLPQKTVSRQSPRCSKA